MKKTLMSLLALAVLTVVWNLPLHSQTRLKIAVIPKGTAHAYWKSVEAGANAAAQYLGAEILWNGPAKENDKAQQISVIKQFIKEGVAGIAVAPTDYTALVKPLSEAMQKNIPVVIFDTPMKGEPGKDYVSFVGTDNAKGGTLGGEHLAKLLGGQGKVLLLRFASTQVSTTERENGFLEAIRNNKGIRIIADNVYAGATTEEARVVCMKMVDKLKSAEGIFCSNESTTQGMLLALRKCNLAGKVKFVGFDTSIPLIEAMKNGEIDALVAQDPTKIGYYSVKTLVEYIRGGKVPPRIDTGVQLVTRDNLIDPEIQKLLRMPDALK